MAKTTLRAPMPPSRRAKQFVPFDALKGLKEAIAQKEHTPTLRRELSEDAIAEINARLSDLKPGQLVTVVYILLRLYSGIPPTYRQGLKSRFLLENTRGWKYLH